MAWGDTIFAPSATALSWMPYVVVAYLGFAVELGPRIMRKREPIRPKPLVVAYNALQVLLNASLLRRTIILMMDEKYHVTCPPTLPPFDVAVTAASRVDDFSKEMIQITYYQSMLRIFDLMDTVFIVLNKRNSYLSFLHIYHHASVIISCWWILKLDAGASITLISAIVNNFVHANMYFYYLLTILGFPIAKVFKRYITRIQIIQFVVVFCYVSYVILRRDCKLSGQVIFVNIWQTLIFLFLFVNFYMKAFKRKKV